MSNLKKLRHVRFRHSAPRILFFDTGYFLNAEIRSAAGVLGWSLQSFPLLDEYADPDVFLPAFLAAVDRFRPDCILTVNHFGVDRSGGLLKLCEHIALPVASWFVDDPLLSLPFFKDRENDWLTVFSYDRGSVGPLRRQGYPNVYYLPLGTDITIFNPEAITVPLFRSDISFVGDGKCKTVQDRLRLGQFPEALLAKWQELAQRYLDAMAVDPMAFLLAEPDLGGVLDQIGPDRAIWYAQLIQAQAVTLHRKRCLEAVLPYGPLLVGGDWNDLFSNDRDITIIERVGYYDQLPSLYRTSSVNLNITGTGEGVPNQRIFDVPACGGFLLTDSVPQLPRLYEPDVEVAVYSSLDELPSVARRWIQDEKGRNVIIENARRRTLAEHTYPHRLRRMGDILSKIYS